ncbi:MAG: tetratricopeptide repeat protein [Microcoleus sp. PH2017_40_RAT_O_B]|jgi:tetratricopeptide (TPR) repeat protein|uniref:tetratricopeptide repeat protein n=1 Tax=unclassified Microcoleus TaxID=2642155 RepID=UPI001D209C8C|nr:MULTISPECIES: tetratricopeptide repeat protein [unclassified Microcoleus]MCC3571016.1 tetratricopeptide repeat protein [Microcoleus sp. PH2017_34_RAT_O_A]MCC3608605.1 tetratricopeptide repeat protein [Microcoleus sp. PH2017_40_RAT_O_B]
MNPETTVIELNQGQQLFTEGNFEGVIAFYRQVLELNSSDSWAHHHMGEALAKLGRLDEAVTAYRHAIKLKPDFSWSYHHLGDALAQQQKWEEATEAFRKGVELNPEHYGTYVGLAKSLAKLGQLHEAIAAYRRASELNPDADWVHHALANALQQRTQSDLTEAIALYRHTIALNPDNLEAYQNLLQVQPDRSETWLQLAQAFVRQEQIEEAIVAYRRAVALNPSLCQAYHELGSLLAGEEKWEEAIVAYQRVIELSPDLAGAYYLLGEAQTQCGEIEKAIASYRWAGEQLAQQGKLEEAIVAFHQILLQKPTAPEYLNLGMLFLQQHRLDESLKCYQKSLEIQPEQADAGSNLATLLVQKGLLDEVIACYDRVFNRNPSHAGAYHQLSIKLAEQGLIDEALVFFHRTPQRQPSTGEVCEYIWKGLNQFGPMDEMSPYCKTEIQWPTAYTYFTQNSDPTIINLYSLTEADTQALESFGYAQSNFKLMEQDNLILEEIYIKNFSDDHEIHLASLGFANFQQSILRTGYIYSVCPISGRILRSNQSLYLCSPGIHFGCQIAIYRFVGSEIFYLIMASCHPQIKLGIYLPQRQLAVKFRNYPVNLKVCIDDLKSKIVANWQDFKYYVSNNEPKEVVGLSGFIYNVGHYFWNDLSGLQDLCESGEYHQLKGVAVADNSFIDINDYFPELISNNINKTLVPIQENDKDTLFKAILKNNWMAFNITSPCIQEKLANRLHDYARLKSTPSFLRTIEESKKHFPLLWITLRSHHRRWLSEVEGITNIINELYKDYPNLGIIFDGHPREKPNVEKILNNISSNINTYNGVECLIHETLAWVHAIDLFIAPIGAGSIFTTIANKTGVFHSNTGWFPEGSICLTPRENGVSAINILKKYIVEGDQSICFTRNYECDWKAIYDEVIKIINQLQQERVSGSNQ